MTTGRGGSAPLPQDDDALAAEKAAFRRAATARRSEAAQRAGPGAALRLRDHVIAAVPLPRGAAVSGFLPIGDEIDLRPTLAALHAAGHAVAVPVVRGRDRPLIFRCWAPDAPLVAGSFGVPMPPEGVAECEPDILLVPLLAFDRRGHRMGYGAGYYDRTLAALRARRPDCRAVGIAYAGQEVPRVPVGANDQPLDLIVTDEGVIHPRPGTLRPVPL